MLTHPNLDLAWRFGNGNDLSNFAMKFTPQVAVAKWMEPATRRASPRRQAPIRQAPIRQAPNKIEHIHI